jgi:hypothetical protein
MTEQRGPFMFLHIGGGVPVYTIVDRRTGAHSRHFTGPEGLRKCKEAAAELNRLFVLKFGPWDGKFIK